MRILVTGATGNVGSEIVDLLIGEDCDVILGTRNGTCPRWPDQPVMQVDFDAGITPDAEFDAIFLMRPPQIADHRVFARFLENVDRQTRIVFLSVEGADRKTYLPHAKIEKVLVEMGFDHLFVRPSYFMENLLTTLWPDLRDHGRIYLPAGRLALDWVSARDVGGVCALGLLGQLKQQAIPVCSGRRMRFDQVCATINQIAGTTLRYTPASLPAYVHHARRKGTSWSYIGVMLLLHFLPRFTPQTVADCNLTQRALGREPETLDAFVARHHRQFATLTKGPAQNAR